ncbi:hypothetical protein TcWFU_010223 [Taenia crassiceps]|uniref:Secreted protein n=1 Tax=Taenia crassiceps TaxID=6207 RepID=A0ABR4QW66_9CEST
MLVLIRCVAIIFVALFLKWAKNVRLHRPSHSESRQSTLEALWPLLAGQQGKQWISMKSAVKRAKKCGTIAKELVRWPTVLLLVEALQPVVQMAMPDSELISTARKRWRLGVM